MKKGKGEKEYSILDFLYETLSKFPNDAEREQIIKGLDMGINYFQNLKERIKSLPNDYKQKEILSAIDTIKNFLISAKENSPLALALGPSFVKELSTKRPKKVLSPQVGEKLFNELKILPTEEIQQKLLDYKNISMEELYALADYLGIEHQKRIKRQDLIDKIVKIGFANIRGYELLRSTKDEKK
nr:Rho termination factor N-terminal domain-containing protein [Candidatus Freyarchaeota archaeon]